MEGKGPRWRRAVRLWWGGVFPEIVGATIAFGIAEWAHRTGHLDQNGYWVATRTILAGVVVFALILAWIANDVSGRGGGAPS